MSPLPPPEPSRVVLFTRRNLALVAIALLTIGGGYAVLLSGTEHAGTAALILVLGYCVLIPLALVL